VAENADEFASSVRAAYQERMGLEPDVYMFRAGEGAFAIDRRDDA
jgi:hypothetical protein